MDRHQYVDLLVSLPHLRNPFASEQTPISRVQLAKRLQVLDPEHRALLNLVSHVLYWGELESEVPESELIRRAALMRRELEDSQLWVWIQWRLDVRFLMAALRLRRDEADPPAPEFYGAYSQYAHIVQRYWNHGTFRLEGRFPWLVPVTRLMEEGDAVALEKALLGEVWRYYTRQLHKVQYGLEAVFLYMARWDLVDRWTGYRHSLARQRFDGLLQASLDQARTVLEREGHL